MDVKQITKDEEIELKKLRGFYQQYLLDGIMAPWIEKTADKEFGGYITDFDRKFSVRSFNKGAWACGRQIYTFSEIYDYIANDEKWAMLSLDGIEFAKEKMYVGHGRFNYLVDRSGNETLDGSISIFSDAFMILGIAKYTKATKDEKYLEWLKELYGFYLENIFNENFKDISPNKWENGVLHHALFMISVNVFSVLNEIFSDPTLDRAMDKCLDVIFNYLYDEKSNCILEKKMSDKSFYKGENAHFVNVGHSFESLWFCLEVAQKRNDEKLIEKIKSIAETTYQNSFDENGNKLFSFSTDHQKQENHTWKYEIEFAPTDKVAWSYAEEMVLWIKLYAITHDKKYLKRFLTLNSFTYEYFFDKKYLDWYHALDKNNKVIFDFKGSTVKCAFHIPRAFMRIMKALDELVEEHK